MLRSLTPRALRTLWTRAVRRADNHEEAERLFGVLAHRHASVGTRAWKPLAGEIVGSFDLAPRGLVVRVSGRRMSVEPCTYDRSIAEAEWKLTHYIRAEPWFCGYMRRDNLASINNRGSTARQRWRMLALRTSVDLFRGGVAHHVPPMTQTD